MGFTVFLVLFVLMGSVCASDDNITSLSQDTYNVIGQEGISTGNEDSCLKEMENENTTLKTSVGGDTFADIQSAIDSAASGDTIELNGLYKGSGTAIVIVKNNLTLIGNDAILDAQGQSRILNITGLGITLKNIKFINGNATDDGGAIYWYGDNGIINNCDFTNNKAKLRGGAIYWYGVNGTVNNSNFINNSVTKFSGSAIQWDANSTNGVVNNCNFTGNTESQKGGAIYWAGVNGTINNSNFINNTGISGGAIYWEDSAFNCTVDNCRFINNSGNDGGAIYWFGANGRMNNCNFTINTATNGGAVNWQRRYGLINNCIFINNTAKSNGGAVFWEGTNSTVNNSNFTNNKASDGGAVYWFAYNGTVNNCNFKDNIATDGGAVYWLGSNGTVSVSNFNNNTAESNGGAIYVKNDNILVLNSKFINNTASEVGAVYLSCGNALINGSDFISNVASDNISAILNAGNLTADICRFIDNLAYSGCTIRNAINATLTLSNSIFKNSCLKGKTVYNDHGIMYLYKNTINNQSGEIFNYGGKILSACTGIVNAGTTFTFGDKTKFVAVITDDNGNLIEDDYYVYFNFNNKLIESTYNSTTGEYGAEYVFDAAGLMKLDVSCPNINITDNHGVNINVLKQNASIDAKDAIYIINYGGKYSIILKDSNGNAVAGEKITFTLNGRNIGSATTNTWGVATITLAAKTLKIAKAGKKKLIIKLSSNNYNTVTKTVKITINKGKTRIVAKNKAFRKSQKTKKYAVILKDSKGKAVKRVKMALKVKGKTYGAKTNSKGKAVFKITKLNKKGKFKSVIKFKGNGCYNAITKKVKITIK